ncbi:MAG: hypothetical protein ACE5H9_13965 [Anaerolineae bacterium]
MDIQQAIERVKSIKTRHEADLFKKANVVGVGVGYIWRQGQLTDDIGLVVNVRRKVPLAQLAEEDVIPEELDGVEVDVNEVGDIRPY